MANHHFFSGDLSGLTMPFSMATTAAATTMFSFALPWTDQPEDSSAAAHLDSAFSFVASCPANGGLPQDGEDAAIGDLIGRLGSICNGGGTSNAASSYSTALSSAPRGAHAGQTLAGSPASRGYGGLLDVRMLPRASSSKSMALENAAQLEAAVATPSDLQENADGEANARKRKAPAKGEAKEASLAMALTAEADASQKRPKHDGEIREESAATEVMDEESYGNGHGSGKAAPEPPRDYIHVRARRGQATDSHSLAERVRRERISERMKMLQSLVPGCNKITGKAVMLDEIINYVQSLQRQVEFLSMELATMNTQFGCNGVPYQQPKDVNMEQKAMPVYPSKDTAAELSYAGMPARYNLVSAASVHHGPNHRDAFQVATFLEQDLQSVVQMGIIHKSQEAGTSLPGYYGQAPVNHMKVEP